MNLFTAVLYLHIATVAVSVGLFVLRYWWMYHQSPLLNQRGCELHRTAAIRCCFSAARG